MSKHRSVWIDTSERPSFPRQTGDISVDVAVVGAGITGLTTALLLQRQGANVAVIEADRIGAGTTGHTTGKVTSQHGLAYHELTSTYGSDVARIYADANEAAIATVARLADETQADCQFTRAASYVYTVEPEKVPDLEREHVAAQSLGLPSTFTTSIDLPFDIAGAVRFDGQAHFHAGRYTAALARTLAANGAIIVEHTRATGVDEGDDGVTVHTQGGSVHAKHAVVATLIPFLDRGGFFAKMRPSRAYGVSARLAADAPAGMHINIGGPTRSTRPWLIDGGFDGLIIVGENHPTGHGSPTSARFGDLERWARQHFSVESFEHRWSAQDYLPIDERPYIGRSPRTDNVLVATGFKKWGLTNGTVAAEILSSMVQGDEHPWLAAFDATRIGDASTVKKLVEENLHVAKRFVTGRIQRLRAASVEHLAPGEGGIVDVDGQTVGAYRSPDGGYHAVSVTCTHMGCTLTWNGAEKSWDCPCHGSRFATDGAVINGPAVRALDVVEVEIR